MPQPIPATDPALTGEFLETQAIYHCGRCHTDFAFSIVAGHQAPPRMPHTGCPAAGKDETP
ncbi:hypothetical protein ACWGI0_23130 [Streptomyces sp. NPDC054802]